MDKSSFSQASHIDIIELKMQDLKIMADVQMQNRDLKADVEGMKVKIKVMHTNYYYKNYSFKFIYSLI